MQNEAKEICENCLKTFPQNIIPTHFAYCRKNIKKCNKCSHMFDINFQDEHYEEYHQRLCASCHHIYDINQKEKHQDEYHIRQTCPHCSNAFPASEIQKHLQNCSKRTRQCQYCNLNIPIRTYVTHMRACESRTKTCTYCGQVFTNKRYAGHLFSCQEEEEYGNRNEQQHIKNRQSKPTTKRSRSRSKQKQPAPKIESRISQTSKTYNNTQSSKNCQKEEYKTLRKTSKNAVSSPKLKNINKYIKNQQKRAANPQALKVNTPKQKQTLAKKELGSPKQAIIPGQDHESTQSQKYNQGLEMVGQDPQLQMAIMRSLGQASSNKNSLYGYEKQTFDKQFIQKEKANLKNKRKR